MKERRLLNVNRIKKGTMIATMVAFALVGSIAGISIVRSTICDCQIEPQTDFEKTISAVDNLFQATVAVASATGFAAIGMGVDNLIINPTIDKYVNNYNSKLELKNKEDEEIIK